MQYEYWGLVGLRVRDGMARGPSPTMVLLIQPVRPLTFYLHSHLRVFIDLITLYNCI